MTPAAPAVPAALGPVLEVADLRITRTRPGGADTIVSSVSLALGPGETIGIVGESGSGKSMTARAITGLLPPALSATGQVTYDGRNLLGQAEKHWQAVRGRQIGLILQDPFTMLNPVTPVGRILAESFGHHRGLGRAQRRAEAVRRLAEVGITDPSVADRYPFQLSGGMRQRVAIAAALARDPSVLIADEPSTALDVATQQQILALIKDIQQARGMALILITHDLRVAFAMCERIYVLYAGTLAEAGPASQLEAEPLHPYTHGLLLSEPPADHKVAGLVRSLSSAERGKTIVCTHFWPTLRPWTGQPVSPESEWLAMTGSDLDALIAECGPRLWLCGHAHTTHHVTIGTTQISSNPRAGDGPGHVNPDFHASYVVEL